MKVISFTFTRSTIQNNYPNDVKWEDVKFVSYRCHHHQSQSYSFAKPSLEAQSTQQPTTSSDPIDDATFFRISAVGSRISRTNIILFDRSVFTTNREESFKFKGESIYIDNGGDLLRKKNHTI